MASVAQIPFEVTSRADGVAARLSLRGELDMAGAPAFAREIERVARGGQSEIVLDLSALSFIDVSGLRAILDAARSARREGRTLVIANPRPHIVRLLELTAIDQSVAVQGRPLSAVS